MAIKRYSSKYKKLARFIYPVWYEKRVKIRKFSKQKWERVKKRFYPRKLKFYRQDVSSYPLTRRYSVDRSIRLKKVYKFLLRDKQRLQLYYGVGKFRFFQLKNMAKKTRSRVVSRKLTLGKAMLSLLEDRLDTALYRVCFVGSIPQARKLIQDGRVKVGDSLIKNSNYTLKPNDIISFDPFIKDYIFGIYLRNHMPYFFFRYKQKRRDYVNQRKDVWEQSSFTRELNSHLLSTKNSILKLKKRIKYDSV